VISILTPLFFFPDLVVINTTPLPAREPYNAAALAPFNTDTFSISLELMSEMAFP